VAERSLGAVYNQSGFILDRDPDVLLEPHIAFVQRSGVPANPDAYPELAPDLVVEIVSPSQTGPSIEEKTSIYLAAGVRLIWIVDPVRRTVGVRRQGATERLLAVRDILDGEDVLPGFQVPVAQLFA
jgi:Uma2 family endonuclease